MSAVVTAVVGTAVVGGAVQYNAAKKGAKAQERAARSGIEAQERALESFNERTQPFVNLGTSAGSELANLLGLDTRGVQREEELKDLQSQLADIDLAIANPAGSSAFQGGGAKRDLLRRAVSEVGVGETDKLQTERKGILSQIQSLEDQPLSGELMPQRGNQLQQLDEINPIVSFLRDQGFEQIQDSAAARGRLGAGGTLKDLTSFNQNLTSTIAPQLQNQRFNQLFNILGLGSNAATGQGTAGLNTASNTANLLGNVGAAQANRATGQANAITNTLGNLAGAAGAFGGSTPPPPTQQIGTINSGGNFGAFA